MKIAIGLAVGTGLLALNVSSAMAGPPAVLPYQAQSQQIAEATFPQVDCPVTIDLTAMPAREVAVATMPGCQIHFNNWVVREPAWAICQAMVHEYGHLAGLGHSPDPTNVMYPMQTPDATPLDCFRLDQSVGHYYFRIPARRSIGINFKVHGRPARFRVLRAYASNWRINRRSEGSFAGRGIHLRLTADKRHLEVTARNRNHHRVRVEVYVGPTF